MKRWIWLMLAMLLLLSACNTNGAVLGMQESLLQAPLLNEQQQQLNEAMGMTMDLADVVYQYPQTGAYRAPFVLFDMDGDLGQEAIVFYALASAPGELRAKFMRQDEPGVWRAIYDMPGYGNQVGFVHFVSLDNGSSCMVIGWENTVLPQRSELGVYYLQGDTLVQETYQGYSAYATHDFSGNGVSDLIFSAGGRNGYTLYWLRAGYDRLTEVGSVPLYRGDYGTVTGILQTVPGILWDQTPAIYIDEVLEDADTSFVTYATEVIRLEDNRLSAVVGGTQNQLAQRANYRATFRDARVLSADLLGDGQVSIPRIENLPDTVDRAEEIETPQIIHYMRLTPQGFESYRTAMINESAGYRVYFPERWIGQVTMAAYPETSEWRFYLATPDVEQRGAELFRVRVYSTRDYSEDIFTEDDILLGTKGIFRYYGYIPENEDEPLAITREEAMEMFSFI
jgi:hypothetical protein